MTVRMIRLLAALLIGVAGWMVALSVPAYAGGACPAGTGVTVVVNSSVSCDRNGGGSAASNFRDAGHTLSTASRQPGFVCRVDGYPASDPCINASPSNAYWALFWANGKGGGWTYASSGASGLSVPAGAWVAFKFQTSSSRSYPAIRPYTAPAAPAPKPRATARSSANGSASASAKPGAKSTSRPKPSDSARPSASARPSPSASAQGSARATDGTTSSEDELAAASQESDRSNDTAWVGLALAVLLVAGIAGATWRRRSAGRQP